MASSTADLEKNAQFMDLYSRQIGAFGLDAMLKLVNLKVLLVGLRGVGIEVAKNTALAGANTITLHDPTPTSVRDLGSNFFLTEGDIGKPRDIVCASRVNELNPLVKVGVLEGPLTEESVAAHDAVVFTGDYDRREMVRWNEFCRTRTRTAFDDRGHPFVKPAPIAFFSCFTSGAMGSVFVDHGPGFTLRDPDGKDPLVKLVSAIEHHVEEVKNPDGTTSPHPYTLVRFITPDGQPPGSFPENATVEFSEIDGMYAKDEATRTRLGPSLNESGGWRIENRASDPVNTFRIGDTTGFSEFLGHGVITEVKQPRAITFRSLAECTTHPSSTETGVITEPGQHGFVMVDLMSQFSSGGVEQQIHVALQGVYAFRGKHGHLPEANNKAHEDECFELSKSFNAAMQVANVAVPGTRYGAIALENLDETVVRRVARFASIELQPMCAFFGGVVAQELVKMSGKFTPIQQWLNFHVFQALPDEESRPADTAPLGSRYDDQIAVFGKAFQDRIGNLRTFMVGCGALGCEFVKNFALMGVCCGPEGVLHITDNDRIEVSNLSRQFLFREDNVGHPKSEAAAARAKFMNPAIRIQARQDLVGEDTEHIFNDEFWDGLDLVCNALDNMKARFYVDAKCVFYEKPLLESGTMGTGANMDIVVPHKTKSYSDGGNADEGSGIPMCTLRNFPHLIDHCIEWARAKFEDLFVSPARQASNFLDDPFSFIDKQRAETLDQPASGARESAISKAISRLRLLKEILDKASRTPKIDDCVEMAFVTFHEQFRNNILDLIGKFPEDAKTSSGDPFWTGHKKFPLAAHFDPSNDLHVDFVVSTANLFASMLGVHSQKHPSQLNKTFAQRWMAEYRDKKWVNGVVARLPVPEYVKGTVADLDEESRSAGAGGSAMEEMSAEDELKALLDDLTKLAETPGMTLVPADFEKDDDDNFHIDFVTATANLRASNYRIALASRHKCKMIAGRIIPAIATSTASVTGLVMMELFKVLQNRPVEALRNGNYDIGTNTYMMFEADTPRKIKTTTVKDFDKASYETELKDYSDAVSETEGRMRKATALIQGLAEMGVESEETVTALRKAHKDAEDYLGTLTAPEMEEFETSKTIVAYPDPHSKWTKINIPATVDTLEGLESFFKSEHKLALKSWSVKTPTGVGKNLFPPEATIDPAHIPAASLTLAAATTAIMRNPAIPQGMKQKYMAAWKTQGVGAAQGAAGEVAAVKSLKRLIEEKGERSLTARKRMLLDNINLETEDGQEVHQAAVVLHF